MTEIETAGDWDIRGPGLDAAFIGRLGDTALTAAQWTSAEFDRRFPGWELYRTVISGDSIHLPKLQAYSVAMARGVSRAKRRTGYPVVRKTLRRNAWLRAAGLDALHMVLTGQKPASANYRSEQHGIDKEIYATVRNAVAGGMTIGLETYRAMLFVNYRRVMRADSDLR
jgi:hypothetical protein